MTPRRKRARKYIALREQLAAALSMLLPQGQRDELRAAKVPAKSVIALFSMDHNHLHALGGPDTWPNLTPMLRAVHKEKSRRDTSIIAKVRRLSPDHEDFRRRMLSARKVDDGDAVEDRLSQRKRTIPSRPFGKGYRALRSRNSFQNRSRGAKSDLRAALKRDRGAAPTLTARTTGAAPTNPPEGDGS